MTYRFEILHGGWRCLSSSLTYIPFFWKFSKFWILYLKQGTFFQKKSFFLNFSGQNLKISKIRDSHLLDLFKCYLLCRFLAIRFTNVFLTNFQTFIFFSHQNCGRWRHKIGYFSIFCPNRIFLSPDDVELMSGESCQVSCRYRLWFRCYSGKKRGAGAENAPQAVKG